MSLESGAPSQSSHCAGFPLNFLARSFWVSIILSTRPRLWALVIGINDYPKNSGFPKLYGAVPDANLVSGYLQTDLEVPPDQIDNRRDANATRVDIIKALERLRDNPEIQRMDPILIYYAGHGGVIPPGDIQAIVPFDYIPGRAPPIPARTLACLINGIAQKKGNNIVSKIGLSGQEALSDGDNGIPWQTVILDCCNAGSATRGQEDDGVAVRGGELDPNDAPDGLDADIYAANPDLPPDASNTDGSISRGLRVAKGFAAYAMRSHVLLAACSVKEMAREDKEDGVARGRFTTALLRMFKNVTPDQVTYFDSLTKMPRIEG